MTSLTLLTLVLVLIGLANPRGYGLALAIAGSTAAGAAASFGGVAVPTFYATAIGAAVIVVLRTPLNAGANRSVPAATSPAVTLLLLLFVWSALVTVIAPAVFPGLQTVTVAGNKLQPGIVTTSNVAQLAYLALGIAVVVFLAGDKRTTNAVVGLSVGLSIALSFWRYLGVTFGIPFPEGLFDNSPTLTYIETAAKDVARFRGIFSEPSSLATACLVMLAYGVAQLSRTRGAHRIAIATLTAAAIYMGSISTSTTFVIAGAVMVAVSSAAFVGGFIIRSVRFSSRTALVLLGLVSAALIVFPVLLAFGRDAIESKVGTSSFDQRSGADLGAYDVFFSTWGLGAGAGAGRASSLLPTVLSTVGIVGTVLLTCTILIAVRQSLPTGPARPVVWALLALLIAKLVSGPDLNDPSGMLWLCLGVLVNYARSEERTASLGRRSLSGPAVRL